MRLPPFDYVEPKSIDDALAMISECQGEARLLSGGTDLLVLMKQRVVVPACVVNLKTIPGHSYIEAINGSGLKIGPLTPLRDLADSPVVKSRFPILAEAAGRVATPLIRNFATIGGNIALDSKCWYLNQSAQWRKSFDTCFKLGGDCCHVIKGGKHCFSVYCPDTVPALMALGAELDLVSIGRKRTLAIEALCTGKGEKPNVIEKGEIITEIRIPEPSEHTGSAFIKIARRGSIDYALVDLAVSLTREGKNGPCRDAKVVVSAIGPGPINSIKAAEAMIGKELDDATFKAAGEAAVNDAARISSVWTSVKYRRHAIRILAARAARQAWSRIV